VSPEKEVVVKDACILFDLIDLGLIEPFFRLDLIVLTTPQVISEVTDADQMAQVSRFLENQLLLIDNLGPIDMITSLKNEHKGLSFADCSVLELAIRKKVAILTSDGSLRAISVRKQLVVHGVLWVVEKLHETKIVTIKTAIEKLNLYREMNARVPHSEIERLINRISSNDQPNG
jgi:predicted nucleic acid-binding protein